MLKLMRAPAKYIQGKDALLSTYGETKNLGTSFLFIAAAAVKRPAAPTWSKVLPARRPPSASRPSADTAPRAKFNACATSRAPTALTAWPAWAAARPSTRPRPRPYYEGLPVLVIPTVSATDAPCTGLSVIYKDDGSFSKYLFYPKNPDVVLVDSTVIANAPVKFLVAGMGDALGTYFEARMCARAKAPSLENGGITRSALALCRLCYETLLENGARGQGRRGAASAHPGCGGDH